MWHNCPVETLHRRDGQRAGADVQHVLAKAWMEQEFDEQHSLHTFSTIVNTVDKSDSHTLLSRNTCTLTHTESCRTDQEVSKSSVLHQEIHGRHMVCVPLSAPDSVENLFLHCKSRVNVQQKRQGTTVTR